ncbi:protein kinase [Clostridium tyrobutyricum]|uniref:protein kinase n=1 Tax=Clostridium tyrobutyricum TaxID=1519 RepID=UPI001C3946F7|nr:protein kinase [Clostridium tyrobutyricum]MBV4420204.1 protein kinase [Clostridium tyrobutyricum]
MSNKKCGYYIQLDDRAEEFLRSGRFLGEGHNGIVYLLPNDKVIKIFKDKRVCEGEYNILKKTTKSKHFPQIYYYGSNYIVRSYAKGARLDYYIKENGLDYDAAHSIVGLLKEFKKLKFTKLDIRCKDLYLDENLYLNVIDPKNNYSKHCIYPRHLMKGLNKLGVLGDFLNVVYSEYNEVYDDWSFRITRYLKRGIK